MIIPLFTGFYISQVVRRISSINSITFLFGKDTSSLPFRAANGNHGGKPSQGSRAKLHGLDVEYEVRSPRALLMGVSLNGGTPKSSTLIGFSINHPFWGTTIFGNTLMAFNHSFKFGRNYVFQSFNLVSLK